MFSFVPEGKRIAVSVEETPDPTLFDVVVTGTIESVFEGSLFPEHAGTSSPLDQQWARVRLDSSMRVSEKELNWLLVSPRHQGYGFCSLCLSSIAVSAFAATGREDTGPLLPEDVVGIWSIKLVR